MIEKPIKDGGPAFPNAGMLDVSGQTFIHLPCDGMSLRDWFAGMAITGILANPNAMNIKITEAWNIADTVLSAREVKP